MGRTLLDWLEVNYLEKPLYAECSEGYSPCYGDRSQCIPNSYFCDSFTDCQDGSDEILCCKLEDIICGSSSVMCNLLYSLSSWTLQVWQCTGSTSKQLHSSHCCMWWSSRLPRNNTSGWATLWRWNMRKAVAC